ncbi:MAG TPA: FKBP-type peptidyl-prolyl cis-trans isomerase [Balneolaceae bacterium]
MRLLEKSSFLQLITAFFVILLIQGCGGDGGFFNGPNYENVPPPFDTANADTSYTTQEGLTVYIIERGNGAFEVISRDEILVRYTGRTKDGEIFDSTYRNGATSRRLLNLTPVPIPGPGPRPISPLIEGFRRGLLGMKEGGKRVLVIPPSLGYGENEGHDLQNDTLIFDIELVEIL